MVTFPEKGEPKKDGDDDMPSVVRSAIPQGMPDLRDTEIVPIRSVSRTTPAKEAADEGRRAGGGRGSVREPADAQAPAGAGEFVPQENDLRDNHRNSRDDDDLDAVSLENDVRESASRVMQSLQRRPSRTPYLIAGLFTVLWFIAAAALIYGFGAQVRQMADEAGLAPIVIGLCGAFGAPVVFFFALASMIARLNELRIVSGTMAEATLHFAQPETAAYDSIMSIGQAIRREVAAMGDGVERALARAVELEGLVNNEVTVLERAYSENEVRIRNLLAGLAQQREILVGQAEQVRNAITHVHLDLSTDITTVSELIAERVNEAARQVTQALAEKGEQITVALGSAGDTMIEQLGDRSTNLLKQIATTSENATHAINAASERMTSGLNFKSEQISEQVLSVATNLEQTLSSRLDETVSGFSQKSATVLATVENRTRELSSTMAERSETVAQSLIDTAGRIAETIASRAEEVNNSLKTTGESIALDLSLRSGDMVSKLEGVGHKITEQIVLRSDYIAHQFGGHAESLATSIAARSDMMRDMLAQRLEAFEQMFTHDGADLAERLARDSANLGQLLTRHLAEFDRTVLGHGSELVENLVRRTAEMQELVANAVAGRDDALAASITRRIDEANAALATRAAAVADNVENQIGRFEEMLVNRVGKAVSSVEDRTKAAAEMASTSIDRIAHEVGSRTGSAVERAAILVGKATEAIESRTHAAADFAASRLAGVTLELEQRSVAASEDLSLKLSKATEDIEQRARAAADFAASRIVNATEQMETRAVTLAEDLAAKVRNATDQIGNNTTEAFSDLLERSSHVSQEFESRTHAAADLMQERASELQHLLDSTSSRLIDAISSKGGEFAAEIERASEHAVMAIDNKAFSFTQSMMNNSTELARVITDASNSATAIVNRTLKELQDSTRNSVSQATILVAQTLKELQQTTRGAIEQSKDVALSTVSEIHDTHDMLRSDATALFERLRDANDLLQNVLGGARSNLNAIEQVLSTRVVEFVSTVERLLESTDAASGKLDRQVSSFYGLTSRVLGDLSELAIQFEGHGKALVDAVASLERANDDTLATASGRRNAIEELAAAIDGRTEQLDAHLKRFSNVIDVSLRSAEDRARDAARLVAEATAEGSRTLAERHAAIRSITEQESRQTLASLRDLHQKVSAEAKNLFQQNAGEAGQLLQQATDRFAEVMHGMKKMSMDMQHELEATRKELRRGVLELPEETAESMAQMRRVMVDQMEALAELNRIVARHGRAMDAVGPAEQPGLRRGFGMDEPGMPVSMTLPETIAGAGRGRASESGPPAAGTTDWNSLQQRGRPEPSPSESRSAAAGNDRSAATRGRGEAPEASGRPAATDWGSLQRGGGWNDRAEPSTEPPARPGASDWSATPSRGMFDSPPASAGQEAGGGGQEGGGGWLSNLLTRASRDGGDAAHADDRGAKPSRSDDDRNGRGIDSVDQLSAHIARWIDHNVAADVWERHNRGERNVNARRLYTAPGRKAFEEMRRRYKSDREFRQAVDRYVGQFDRFLGQVGHQDGGEALARNYITSEAGQVYTMLAHAAGRFE